MDEYKTVFERVECLRQVNKILIKEITDHWYLYNIPAISITNNIIIASLMTALLKTQLKNPLLNMLLLKYFLCVDYNLPEVDTIIKNFLKAVKGLSKTALKDTSRVIECDHMLTMKDLIVNDFFITQRKKVLSRAEKSFHKPVIAYTKQYANYFLPEDVLSDAETDEVFTNSHI